MGVDIGYAIVSEQVADRAIGLARSRQSCGPQHAARIEGAQCE